MRSRFALLLALAIPVAGLQAQWTFGQDLTSTSNCTPNSGLGPGSGGDWGYCYLSPSQRVHSNAARATFSTSGVIGTETFSGQTLGNTAPIVTTFPASSVTATLTGAGVVADGNYSAGSGEGSDAYQGLYGTTSPSTDDRSTDKFWRTTSGSFTLTFNQSVGGFGFTGIDIGDVNQDLTVSIYSGTTKLSQYTVNDLINYSYNDGEYSGNVLFLGYTSSTGFDKVVFSETGSGDAFAFDDMTVKSLSPVVPEPASMSLLATGLVGLAGVGRRRRRRQG